jgi:hypothetical protein
LERIISNLLKQNGRPYERVFQSLVQQPAPKPEADLFTP